jgi:hypothetical protein
MQRVSLCHVSSIAIIAYAHYLRVNQVRAVCVGLTLLPNIAIDKATK